MQTKHSQSSIQLIDGDGYFNMAGAEMFQRAFKINEFGRSYGVISVMGPQSGGKSTLLNNMFGTNFVEMDEQEGRNQTTRGVWMAVHSSSLPITVLDVEGCDGRERGEATLFERQTALFNLAVSDVVLINIGCNEVGREQAAGKPMMRTIFQVMKRLFNKPQKTTLMFVLRDKTGTPLPKLAETLREDTEKLWNSAPKSKSQQDTPMDHFFNIEVKALSHYHYQPEQFKKEVVDLKAHLIEIIRSKRLAGDSKNVIHASEFFRNAEHSWNIIKRNEDLDIPTQRVLLAHTRCGQISDRICSSFNANQNWCSLRNSVQSGIVGQFGSIINPLLLASVQDYEEKTAYLDETIRNQHGDKLKECLLRAVQPAWRSLIEHQKVKNFVAYKAEFDKALQDGKRFTVAASDCAQKYIKSFDAAIGSELYVEFAYWNASQVRGELQRNIEEYKESISSSKFSTLASQQEGYLKGKLSHDVALDRLLDEVGNTTWQEIRELIEQLTESCVSEINGDLVNYGLSEKAAEIRTRLRRIAGFEAELKVKEKLSKVAIYMKQRFDKLFKTKSIVGWKEGHDIPEKQRVAYASALELLSFYAAIRLDDEYHQINYTLFDVLLESPTTSAYNLDKQYWQDVPKSRTLITPISCKSYWEKFESQTSDAIAKAISQRELNIEMKEFGKTLAGAAVVVAAGAGIPLPYF